MAKETITTPTPIDPKGDGSFVGPDEYRHSKTTTNLYLQDICDELAEILSRAPTTGRNQKRQRDISYCLMKFAREIHGMRNDL